MTDIDTDTFFKFAGLGYTMGALISLCRNWVRLLYRSTKNMAVAALKL